MLILFDHGTPSPLRAFLAHHDVLRTHDLEWDRLSNGDLLAAAESKGFDLLVTTDKNIRYQQNLATRVIGIVVLGNAQWPVLLKHVRVVIDAIDSASPGSYIEVAVPK